MGHAKQLEDAVTFEYLPLGQAVHVLTDVAPVSPLYLPDGQPVQGALP